MSKEPKELIGTTINDQKIIFGEAELTNLVKTLIHIYQFRNKNQSPEAVVFPDITEVDGVRVEFPIVEEKIIELRAPTKEG